MNIIEDFLMGRMDMPEFLALLETDLTLQGQLRNLVPYDAVNNPDHEIWKKYSYGALSQFEFDCYARLMSCYRFDLSLGDNLNIFGFIRRFYCYSHPNITCTKKYDDAFNLYLDVIKDCYDGPEVRHFVERIIYDALTVKPKKARIAKARFEMENMFHLADKSKPRWIQGPEWPMGQHSPMRFVSQKRSKEFTEYIFEDFDTKKQRIITQHY